MTLAHIAAFTGLALVYGLLLPARLRGWAVLAISVIAVYWLQPALPVRYLDFALPTATLLLTTCVWWLTRPAGRGVTRDDGWTLALIGAIVLALALTRNLRADLRLTASRPPDALVVAVVLALIMAALLVVWQALHRLWPGAVLIVMMIALVVLFVVQKAEPLAVATSALLRAQTGQQTNLAALTDLQWLGFSYLAFRLLHTLRDRQTGRLPALSLREYTAYALFFPALTAGPIDRAERFVADYQALSQARGLLPSRLVIGGTRISIGLLKKFVLADSLALFALNPTNAAQTSDAGALWVLLYAYAWRLFLDFSGYTDIAIGLGILFGVRLPENFDRPYLRQNITTFWQSWHMTLSNWVRFYVFSPLSRALLQRRPRPTPLLVVFSAQVVTMLIIGLWHGVTLNFAIWGLWHGLGLFAHKVWSDHTRVQYMRLAGRPRIRMLWHVAGVVMTFHFVALGWVWFALPDTQAALAVFARLFGIGR